MLKSVLCFSLLACASAEEILGSFIFARHGDRLKKPTVFLTPIGAQEEMESGNFYNERYFKEFPIKGLDTVYNPKQFVIQVPTSDVLFKSMMSFTQGFYPPLNGQDLGDVQGASLGNGTDESTPLDGYQYVMLDSIDENSSDYWKLKGDEDCPVFDAASKNYLQSDQFKQLNSSTLDFYKSLESYTHGEIKPSKMNYGNAYNIYDFFLTQQVHNQTFVKDLDADVLLRVQALSDLYSRGLNDDSNNATTLVGGKTLLGVVGDFLTNARNASNPQRMQVMGGSYDQFYQAFGLLNLYKNDDALFTGIVDYASTLVFELFKEDNDNTEYIRVGLRNGTTVSQPSTKLNFWPVFSGSDNKTSADSFLDTLSKVSINKFEDWCNACNADTDQCNAMRLQSQVQQLESASGKKSSLSLADAGGIGAGVTIGVFMILGAIGFLAYRMFGKRSGKRTVKTVEDSYSLDTAGTQV